MIMNTDVVSLINVWVIASCNFIYISNCWLWPCVALAQYFTTNHWVLKSPKNYSTNLYVLNDTYIVLLTSLIWDIILLVDEASPQVQNESTDKPEYDDTLLNESPSSDTKDMESSSLGDDFEKIEEGDYVVNDQKDTIGDDFDIIGMDDDQHFEVLDTAVGDNDHLHPPLPSSTTDTTTIIDNTMEHTNEGTCTLVGHC